MSEFNSKSRRQKSIRKSGIDIARIEENFRAFVSLCLGAEKGKRASHR
jgi:hypothetical protein